jgi:hypothetical protein
VKAVGSTGVIIAIAIAAASGLLAAKVLTPLAEPSAPTERDSLTNPVYSRFEEIGAREGIDVAFTRTAKVWKNYREQRRPIHHPIFRSAPGSWDVIIFGDSTVAWGLIPKVISQRSGLRTAIFAHAASPLNQEAAYTLRRIIDRYLAPGGRAVFMFSALNQDRPPERRAYGELRGLSDEAFATLAEEKALWWWSYEGYTEWREDQEGRMVRRLGLALPSVDLYRGRVEPWLNPAWYERKQENEEKRDGGYFFAWDSWGATFYTPEPAWKSMYSGDPTQLMDKGFREKSRTALQVNSVAICDLPGRKLYGIPWYAIAPKYKSGRMIYENFYQRCMGLLDMGMLHERGVRYPMKDVAHLANEAGLLASIAIGDWLRENP